MKTTTDFLVVGSGIAGLSFAIHAADYGNVTIITKKNDKESNTNYAQGGIACVMDPTDSHESHIRDTINTGRGLCSYKSVEIMVNDSFHRIRELLEWGAVFTKNKSSSAYGKLDLGREGGHKANRIVHARDLTGKEVEKTLIEKAEKHPSISIAENNYAVELITNHHLKSRPRRVACYGVYVLDENSNRIFPICSKITYLSTGGTGRVYLHTTNPEIATGDGIAAAYRAGAKIANMEFIQFHPTKLYNNDEQSFLISEVLRGFGAKLCGKDGKGFMGKYHKMKSLAPRDVVARAIDSEIKKSGAPCVYLDIRHKPSAEIKRRFPNIYKKCRSLGIDITKDLIPVVPAAHYSCGGIEVDTYCKTSIKNLYACGESACTGVHGANRLASNSLLEALVFSKRAADDAKERIRSISRVALKHIPAWDDSGTTSSEEWVLLSHNFQEVRQIMWDYVGIVRSNLRLKRAMRRINLLEKETEDFYKRTKITPALLELRNMITISKLIITCASKRHESRGLHYTTDYPLTNDRHWKKYSYIQKHIDK